MEIRRTRINYRLLGQFRNLKFNGVIDKTMYAKKLGIIKNDSNVIVIDVTYTQFGALRKIYKHVKDFGYNIKTEKEKIKNVFSFVKDEIKSQYLIVCDKEEYMIRTKTKLIKEHNFIESTQYIDDNYSPLRINFELLSKIEEERNRIAKGEDYIISIKYEKKKEKEKSKVTFKKIMSGILEMVFTTSLDGV